MFLRGFELMAHLSDVVVFSVHWRLDLYFVQVELLFGLLDLQELSFALLDELVVLRSLLLREFITIFQLLAVQFLAFVTRVDYALLFKFGLCVTSGKLFLKILNLSSEGLTSLWAFEEHLFLLLEFGFTLNQLRLNWVVHIFGDVDFRIIFFLLKFGHFLLLRFTWLAMLFRWNCTLAI